MFSEIHKKSVEYWQWLRRFCGLGPKELSEKTGIPVERIRSLQEPSQAAPQTQAREDREKLIQALPDDERSNARFHFAATKSTPDVAEELHRLRRQVFSLRQKNDDLRNKLERKDDRIDALTDKLEQSKGSVEELDRNNKVLLMNNLLLHYEICQYRQMGKLDDADLADLKAKIDALKNDAARS